MRRLSFPAAGRREDEIRKIIELTYRVNGSITIGQRGAVPREHNQTCRVAMNKQDYFNEFKEGRRDLFFIVARDYDRVLRENHMVFRKVDEIQTSIIGFITREEAEDFLRTVMTEQAAWKVTGINVLTFDDFLESLENAFREHLVFELI